MDICYTTISVKITLICGSTATKSHTRCLLKHIESLLHEKSVETSFWDLRDKHMVFAVPELHATPMETPDKNVKDFIKLIESSDGIVIGSPLYHGSYSGVLKNALDNLYLDAFRNKAVALVSHGYGVRNAIKACEHLRSVIRTLYGYTLQTEIGTGMEDYQEADTEFTLTNKDIKERCVRLVNELINLTKILKASEPNKK